MIVPYPFYSFVVLFILVSIGNCGGRIKAKEGVIASPGFPENYSTETPKVCQWVIDLSDNGDTIVDFPMFDLDPSVDDLLEVSLFP